MLLKISLIHRKVPALEPLFNEVPGWRAETLLKRDSGKGVFLSFARFSRIPFLEIISLYLSPVNFVFINTSAHRLYRSNDVEVR